MKITKQQLAKIIKEEISAVIEKADINKELDDARKYRTKGEWRIHASGTGKYLKPGWRSGEGMEIELGDSAEAKVFDNELSAIVDKKRIEDDKTTDYDGVLEIVGEPFEESKMKITKEQLANIVKEEYDAAVSEAEKTSRMQHAERVPGRGVGDLIKAANNVRNNIEMTAKDASNLINLLEGVKGPLVDAVEGQNYDEIPRIAAEYVEKASGLISGMQTSLKEIELNAGSLGDEGQGTLPGINPRYDASGKEV